MNNPMSTAAAQEARRAEGLSFLAARESTNLGIHLALPLADAAHNLAHQLSQANLHQSHSRSNRTDHSFSLVPLLISVYLPDSSYLELSRLILPDHSNPFIQLENAETTEELIACHAGLERLLGRDQTGKLEMLSTDSNDRAAFPARMIRSFLRVAPLSPQEFNELPNDEQREGINAFATYLVEYIGSHPLCSDISERLSGIEAVLFLGRVPQADDAQPYNQFVSHAQQELGLRAVKEDGTLLLVLPHDLRNNLQIVEQAIIETADALSFASDDLQNNPNIQKLANYRSGALSLENPVLQTDTGCRLMVEAAVRQDGLALEFASEALRGNYEIVLAAVAQHPWALKYASDTLRNNSEIVLTAVEQHGLALQYASDELRNNHDIVLYAVIQDGWSLKYASEALRDNFIIARAAVMQDSWSLKFAGNSIKNNHEIVIAAVRHNGLSLEFASDELKSNRDVVLAAVQENPRAFHYANQRLSNGNEIFTIAARQAFALN